MVEAVWQKPEMPKPAPRENDLSRKLDAVSWGLFFIWVGVALFLALGLGAGLIGVGVITLGAQLARKAFGLTFEGFWLVAGLAFLGGGVWALLGFGWALVPVLLVLVGAAIIVAGVRPTRPPAAP